MGHSLPELCAEFGSMMPAPGRSPGKASAVDPGGMPATAGINCFSGRTDGCGTIAVVADATAAAVGASVWSGLESVELSAYAAMQSPPASA